MGSRVNSELVLSVMLLSHNRRQRLYFGFFVDFFSSHLLLSKNELLMHTSRDRPRLFPPCVTSLGQYGPIRATGKHINGLQRENRGPFSPRYQHPSGFSRSADLCDVGDRLYVGTANGNLSVYSIDSPTGIYQY